MARRRRSEPVEDPSALAAQTVARLSPWLDERTRETLKAALLRPQPTVLRANPGRLSDEALDDLLVRGGWPVESVHPALPQARRLDAKSEIGRSLEHAMGLLYIQEAPSMLPALALSRLVESPRRLLDLCAAPGGKTTQLAAAHPDALLLANEPQGSRLSALVANLLRCGFGALPTSQLDGCEFGERLPRFFDGVLVDAPCSADGNFRRDRRGARRRTARSLEQVHDLQSRLIESAWEATAEGGVMLYSTCSLSPEENQEICRSFRDAHAGEIEGLPLTSQFPDLGEAETPEGWLWLLPQHLDGGGFFLAAFGRRGARSEDRLRPPRTQDAAVETELAPLLEHFGIESLSGRWQCRRRGGRVEVGLAKTAELPQSLPLNRAGFRPLNERGSASHEFALTIGDQATRNSIEVDHEVARHFLQGNDPTLDEAGSASPLLLRREGQPLGLVRQRRGRFENQLPSEARRPGLLP